MSLEWVLFGLRVLTTVILYTFLGLAFYIIWRDLKQAGNEPVISIQAMPRLRIVAAAEDKSFMVGDILPLQPVTHLGRDLENTIVIKDTAASARHARLSRENGVWWLEDLGSRNGTLLNGLPLSKPTSLADGDIISIGNIRFQLEADRH